MLRKAKVQKIPDELYLKLYRLELNESFAEIEQWLTSLRPEKDKTLLSWEAAGVFSHRNLVLKFIEKYRPDCYGGADVLNVSVRYQQQI
jgi:hypothetical protein